jgi:two-component system CheB/CheR fusion protein
VVGLGASAGGIKALKEFFRHVPPQTGAAYAVILHLSPDHESRLAEVLQTTAQMPVAQVTESTPIAPDRIYVVPPNKSLIINDGLLTVAEFTHREQRRTPVDVFFRALADTYGSRSVCVILSGTGPNGSAGLKRIKEYDGLVIAQDPIDADYPDMPRNAIATGLVDMVLPAAEIPAQILSWLERVRREDQDAPAAVSLGSDDSKALGDVLALLRVRTGHDFTNYKSATLRRRVERRMNLRGVETVAAYVRLIRQEPPEAVLLMREVLISVTNFFRDGTAWAALADRVIPRLSLGKGAHDQIRVWVPGCATGEEAYSVAMLLAESAAVAVDRPMIQVFATDLDQHAISIAREGLYTAAEVSDVSEERLQRFFIAEASGFRVRRELRELVLFAHHNVIKDPPFLHLDLICCRNLLIYLDRAIQERIIETFHYALRPGAYLFLGTSESPDGSNDLFLGFDNNAHIYESRAVTSRLVLPTADSGATTVRPQPRPPDSHAPDRLLPADLHQRILERYAPPSLIVNEEHIVVHMSERVGRFMQIGGGEPSRDVVRLARPELQPDLRTALHQAIWQRSNVDIRGIAVTFDEGVRLVDLSVKPVLRDGDPARGYILVTFDERTETSETQNEPALTYSSPVDQLNRQLEEELTRVKAQLGATIQQYETQAEEGKASNEELQAMNEELRSIAEELETSKEELQSLNEELATVNQELKIKIDELGLTNTDFQNFINATDIGTIFLDRALRVKFSTRRAREVFNLLETDIGRPLADITSKLRVGIHKDVGTVLERLTSVDREVQTEDDRWHLMRLLPYRTNDNRIDGVVITFQDVTERRRAELRVRESEDRLRLMIDGALDYAMFTTTEDGTINSWNPGAQRMFGYTADEIVGRNFDMLFTPEDRTADVPRKELAEAGRSGRAADERYHVRKDGTHFYCSGVTRRQGAGGIGFAKIARDLTGQRRAADALQQAHDDLDDRVRRRTSELESEVADHDAAKRSVTSLLHRLVSAQEDERRRIARELHDHFGQQLTALRLTLERSQRQAEEGRPSQDEIRQALTLTQQIGSDLEFLGWELRPIALDELGLAAALPRFVSEWSAHVGIPAEFRFSGFEAGRLSRAAEVAFFRVAQEALNNVAKHAHASRTDVVLASSDGQIVLVVEDDGAGFDVGDDKTSGDGFGLAGMRERAGLVGATLQIESTPGKGTSVFLRCPTDRGTKKPAVAGEGPE